MLFFFVRHGHPIYIPDSLTELGHAQAEALSHRFALHGLDRIYASSHIRAIQTAEPTAKLLGLPVEILDWANEGYAWREMTLKNEKGNPREWCFDDEEFSRFMNSEEVRALGDEWYRHPALAPFEAGYRRIANAGDAFLESLGYRHDLRTHTYEQIHPNHERIAFFAHGGTGIVFLSHLLDLPFPTFTTHFGMSHSGVSVIAFGEFGEGEGEPILPRMIQFANDSHLYHEGIPTKFCNKFDV